MPNVIDATDSKIRPRDKKVNILSEKLNFSSRAPRIAAKKNMTRKNNKIHILKPPK
jgi:hypothetical protein